MGPVVALAACVQRTTSISKMKGRGWVVIRGSSLPSALFAGRGFDTDGLTRTKYLNSSHLLHPEV